MSTTVPHSSAEKPEQPEYPEAFRTLEQQSRGEKWARRALEGECKVVASAANGTRNDTLNKSAFRVGQIVGAGYLNRDEVTEDLLTAAAECGLLADDGEAAARSTIDSGLNAGQAQPRHPHEKPGQSPQGSAGGSTDQGVQRIAATPFALPNARTFPRRQWLYARHYIRRFVTATAAPGGRGKSSLIGAEAMAMVSGRDLLGKPVKKPLRVWYMNLEDPREETERRLIGIALRYHLTAEDLGGRLYTDSGRDQTIQIARQEAGQTIINTPLIEAIVAEVKRRGIDVLIIDPFVSSHNVNENDNGAIDQAVKAWARIADRCNCAVELVHHVRKGAVGFKHEIDADDMRGAGSLQGAVRSVRVINAMSAEEAQQAGVENRHEYVKLTNGKPNMAPRSDKADWYRIVSVSLDNGDEYEPPDHVGVVESWQWPDAFEGRTVEDLKAVQRAVADGEWREDYRANAWVGKAIAGALGLDLSEPAERARVKCMLREWLKNDALRLQRRQDSTRQERAFVVVGEWAE